MSQRTGLIVIVHDDEAAFYDSFEDLRSCGEYPCVVVVSSANEGFVHDVAQRFGTFDHLAICKCGSPTALSVTLNIGISHLIETYPNLEFVGWVHTDMKFPHKNWISILETYMDDNPTCGKVSPDSIGRSSFVDRPGNECPWIIRTDVLHRIHAKDGFFFDPQFLGIGGYEDWDMNNRILDAGFGVMITGRTGVLHPGMGTRVATGKSHDAEKNSMSYYLKWGRWTPRV